MSDYEPDNEFGHYRSGDAMTPQAQREGFSADKPTKIGWYWWRSLVKLESGEPAFLTVVFIDDDGYCQDEGEYVDQLGGEWAGPLLPPDAPTPPPREQGDKHGI